MANITAKLNATTASGPKQVSVTVPATTTKLNRLQDVNVTSLSDGALLQYDDTTKKWTSRSDILTESGNLILNGGTF
jgi:phage baseplate assembly protein gpV